VKLWSLPGTGSTFTLRIPVHLDQVDRALTLPEQELATTHGGEL
jgi:two-component system sensor histidine kinase SenX3